MIDAARRRTYQAANAEMVTLFWQLGEHVSRGLASAASGDGVVDELAATIAEKYPSMHCYTHQNLIRMRQFYEAYRRDKTASAVLRQLPWTHHLLILDQAKLPEERRFYILAAITANWTSAELERQLHTQAFRRQTRGTTACRGADKIRDTAIDERGSACSLCLVLPSDATRPGHRFHRGVAVRS